MEHVNVVAAALGNGVSEASKQFFRRFGIEIEDGELAIELKESAGDAVEVCIRDKLLSDEKGDYEIDPDKFDAFLDEVPAHMIKDVYEYLDGRDNRSILNVMQDEDVRPEDMEDDVQAMFVKEFRFGEWGYAEILAYKTE